MHFVLFVISKNGQLVYTKPMAKGVNFSANDSITLASTFHSVHAISSQIVPESSIAKKSGLASPVLEGITEIVADTFTLKAL